jgi:transcriptional regulator with XRE-family HTH domain
MTPVQGDDAMFEPLPTLIRMERERQGLTQDALAKLAKISRSRLASLEKGDDNLSLKLLLKVANTLRLTELRIGGLHVVAAPPELTVLLAAADAIETARKVVDHATTSRGDLERVSATVSALLDRVLTPVADPGIAQAAERLMSRPDERATGRALRELAEAPDLPGRTRARNRT